jgi:hypothetical protein
MDRIIHFTMLASELDNRVTDQHQLSWDDLTVMLGEHDISDRKEVRMICPAQFRTDDDLIAPEPAPLKVYRKDASGAYVKDTHGDKIVERIDYPINPDTGRPYIRRCRENAIGLHFLACDFDNGITLDEAIARFSDLGLEFCFYTSFNHLKSDGIEKFRLFFPFTSMAPTDEFIARRDAICAWLGSADRVSVAVSQGYYIPTCPVERVHLARAGRVEGRWLDWQQFGATVFEAPPEPPENPIQGDQLSAYVRAAITRECDRLASCAPGERHSTLVSAATSLGQLVAAGALTRADYEGDLTNAALIAGMTGRMAEIRKAVTDGLAYGRRKPRVLPSDRANLGRALTASMSQSALLKAYKKLKR